MEFVTEMAVEVIHALQDFGFVFHLLVLRPSINSIISFNENLRSKWNAIGRFYPPDPARVAAMGPSGL